MSLMLNALKQIEAMSPHPPLPPLSSAAETGRSEDPSVESREEMAEGTKADSSQTDSPNASSARPESPETVPPEVGPTSDAAAEAPPETAETLGEVRDEMAMTDSLLKAEAAMVAESLPTVTNDSSADIDKGAQPQPAVDFGTAFKLDADNRKAYESLGDEIISKLVPGRSAALMFSSPNRGEDTTSIALSLAATLVSRIESPILLVDVDLHRPRLANRLGIEASRGLADVLQGTKGWRQVIRPTSLDRVSLLPGVERPWQGGTLQRLDLGSLLDELTAEYRLVLLDTASLENAEVAPISRWCQGTYLAVRLGRTRRGEAAEAERIIRGNGGQVSGCVVVG